MPYYRRQKRHTLREVERRLRDAMYSPVGELTVEAWVTQEPVPFEERQSGKHLELKPGDKWGGLFDCAWFRFTGAVPRRLLAGRSCCSSTSMVRCSSSTPRGTRQGLTSVTSGYDYKRWGPASVSWTWRVPSPPVMSLKSGPMPAAMTSSGCFRRTAEEGGRVAVRNTEIWALHYDFEVLRELMEQLPRDLPLQMARSGLRWTKWVSMAAEPTEEIAAEARRCSRRYWRPRAAILRSPSAPSVTHTWIWPGCGRSVRRSESAPAPSPWRCG